MLLVHPAGWCRHMRLLEAIVLLSYPAGSSTFHVAPGLLNVATSHRCHCCSMGGFGAPQPKAAAPKKPLNKKDFERQMNSYNALRIDGYPPPNVVDVYVHAPGKDKFWFVGKVAARAEATDDYGLAAVVQKRLVFEHAKLLQPREIGLSKTLEVRGANRMHAYGLRIASGCAFLADNPCVLRVSRSIRQLWCAPPNSEMKVAQRQQALRRLDGLRAGVDGTAPLTIDDCGFLPEQYTAEDQKGFYVRLPPDGVPREENRVQIMSPGQAAASGYLDKLPTKDAGEAAAVS